MPSWKETIILALSGAIIIGTMEYLAGEGTLPLWADCAYYYAVGMISLHVVVHYSDNNIDC